MFENLSVVVVILLILVVGILAFFWVRLKKLRAAQNQNIAEIRKAWDYLNDDMQRLANEIQVSAVRPLSQVGQKAGPFNSTNSSTEFGKSNEINKINKRLKNISHELAPQNLKKLGLIPSIQAFLENTKLKAEVSFQHFGMSELDDFAVQWHLLDVSRSIVTYAIEHCKATKINLQLLHNENGIVVALDQNGKTPEMESDQFIIARNAEKLYAVMRLFHATSEVTCSEGEMNCVRLRYPKHSLAA